MKRIIFLLKLTLLCGSLTFGQQLTRFTGDDIGGRPMMADGDGKPLYLKTSYTAEGSPYLYDDYREADIVNMDGTVYRSIKAKINLLEKLLLYKREDGTEMEITVPVKCIRFYPTIEKGIAYPERVFQGYLLALNAPDTPLFELITTDTAAQHKVLLYKETRVSYNDTKAYGEAGITRKFTQTAEYYAAIPGDADPSLVKLQKNTKAVAALFGSHAEAVNSFIRQNKLKCKTDEELLAVCRYYQSL